MNAAPPRLWAVVGATGTGKSGLSLELAAWLESSGGAEIVGADAMQLYRGMDIGTAKLPRDDRRGIPHHLIDVLPVSHEATVQWYQAEARSVIRDILDRGRHAIVVGGSGLYVSSVLYDFSFPPRDSAVRARLEREADERGIGALVARLREIDPVTAERIDAANPRRVIRALEVIELGERTHGATLPAEPVPWREAALIGTQTERSLLVERLDRRVDGMWREGIVDEVARLLGEGLEDGTTAKRAIGYAQALAQLRGELTSSEAIAQTQALTRRYARRQVSWFRRYQGVRWLDAADTAQVGHLRREVTGDGFRLKQ